MTEPTFFETEADFRRWLAAHHETAPELLVGFWKKGSGRPSIDWPQARDQALCFGWIDGVRKSLGRGELHDPLHAAAQGQHLVERQCRALRGADRRGADDAAGVRAYEENKGRQGVYAYENALKELTAAETAAFRKNKAAWADWEKRPPATAGSCSTGSPAPRSRRRGRSGSRP